jgi:hypothetical protein
MPRRDVESKTRRRGDGHYPIESEDARGFAAGVLLQNEGRFSEPECS